MRHSRWAKVCGVLIAGWIGTMACGSMQIESEPPRAGWWPSQQAPSAYVTVDWPAGLEDQVIVQAVAGLMARMVNEGAGDELIWIVQRPFRYQEWRDRTVRRLGLKDGGSTTPETLLARAVTNGWVKGYVLYTQDAGEGRPYQPRAVVDHSLNTATMAAARLRAVPVTTASEERMKALGLTCLYDARGVDPLTYFEAHRVDFDGRGAIGLIDPRTANNRDMIIAHMLPATYGTNANVLAMLQMVKPPAAVIGWGTGDEFEHCSMVSRFGHLHTVSNWILNGPFYSAGSDTYEPQKIEALDPRKIDWSDTRRCVAMMNSDGDNASYIMGGLWSAAYWESPLHGSFPMGWSVGAGDMAGLAPVVMDRLAETKSADSSVIQFGGGYFYPDLFAMEQTNRWEVLREHARKINQGMIRTGVTMLTLILEHSETPDAQTALQIFAEEIPSLLGIMVMDYAPYHRGDGRIDWIPDGRGGLVPAVCARYSMWEGMNKPRAGSPEKLASEINADDAAGLGGWVAVHAWSKHIVGENGASRQGLPAVDALLNGLDADKVRVVSPEELIWRIRRARLEGNNDSSSGPS